jgi:hypothetical protein
MKTNVRKEALFLALVLSAITLAQGGETTMKEPLPEKGKSDRHLVPEKVSFSANKVRSGFSPAPYGGGLAQFLH